MKGNFKKAILLTSVSWLYCGLLVGFILSNALAEESTFPVKIGVIAPLTGRSSPYGIAVKDGIELARIDHPEAFSHVTFLYEDDQYDSKMSVNAYNKLRDIDHVDLVYAFGANALYALAPLAESSQFPLISLNASAGSALGKEYVIRFANYSGQYVGAAVDYWRKRGKKRYCLVLTEIEFLADQAKELKQTLQPGETVEQLQSFNPPDNDFRSVVSRLKTTNCDVLAVYLMFGQISQFYKQKAEQHLDLPSLGSNFFESKTELAQARGTMEGAIFPTNKIEPWFHERYLKRYGDHSEISMASRSYDFALLSARLFAGKSGKLSSAEIIRLYESSGDNQGATGPYVFRHNARGGKYFEFDIAIRKIQGSQSVVAE